MYLSTSPVSDITRSMYLAPLLTLFPPKPGRSANIPRFGVAVNKHYGSRSKRGTEVAALFYTMLETAKLSDVDPRTYLEQAPVRAIEAPGAVTLPRDLT